jgi:hypothetical protein
METIGLSHDQEERRKKLWHELLAQLPPDERDRIRENPEGEDAVSLAMMVELFAMAEEINPGGQGWPDLQKEWEAKNARPTQKTKVVLMRSSNDPMCLRISAGGTKHLGFYFNFRGDPLDVVLMLERVTEAFKARLASGKPFEIGDQHDDA